MHEYEITVLFSGNLEDKALKKAVTQLETYLEKVEAKFKKGLDAKSRDLVYEINKLRKAFEVFVESSLGPDKVSLLDNFLKNDDNVVRYLIVKKI